MRTNVSPSAEGKRPLGRHSCRWENKIYLNELLYDGVDWIKVAQELVQWQAPVNTVMNLQDSQMAEN
jgi:hypothetical protein